MTISSWALEFARDRGLQVLDNRAVNVPCYAPTHTFVEKLQTISTKHRRLAETKAFPANLLRHYYDVYCLIGLQEVQALMQTTAYQERKVQRFRSGDELVIAKNPVLTQSDPLQRDLFAQEYRKTSALYYRGQPEFDQLLAKIKEHLDSM